MEHTKERILEEALTLFAREGYEGVSMRMIAERLGITKAALYKHYESKQAIFDHIVCQMQKRDAQKAAHFPVSSGTLKEKNDPRRAERLHAIKEFSLAMFRYWTEDAFACSYRKMLTLEQYRNPQIAELQNRYLTGGVIGHAKELIQEAAGIETTDHRDAEVLALEYFAPIYMMMGLADRMENKEHALELVVRHIDSFMEHILKD